MKMSKNNPVSLPFWERDEFIIPLALFLLFLAITLPGISWGYPDGWHPDEIVTRAIWVLNGEWKFSEINFDYPDLPQYVMLGLGKLTLALGYGEADIRVAARVLSAILAGLTIVITYHITRRISGDRWTAALSGLLLLSVSALSHNGRFAHNDTYITFFAALVVLFLVNYRKTEHRGWLYASFLAVGMAASSKYNGISLVIAPAVTFIVQERKTVFKHLLKTFETVFISGALTFLGFALGTPKALFWMSYYFKRMLPALLHTGNYARQPDSVRGILGQYGSFADGTGLLLFLLFAIALIWAIFQPIRAASRRQTDPQTPFIGVLLLSILALDLPILISYNYPTRFFLPIYPLFAILAALFIAEMYKLTQYRKITGAILALIILFSFARNISVMLLFFNDARIPASRYVASLPVGTSLEETYYPPYIPDGHFAREHNYPIYFKKSPEEELPTSRKFVFNAGEVGLDDRQTDYLLTDSFTYERFNNPYICESMPAECAFFQKLATGQSDHYKLIAEFHYSLPPYLPQLSIAFVNPGIRIYERIQ
jgi:4-amino-4-deoxy-L-arabinose transferase-like glycosyltransferase